ncbi:hypothetical protein FACS1894106_1590 [Spirochaetia bacterium]|nr:hypothetical protein FACS1894106_1590 [Spirochaetia bacterium]
MNHTLKTILKRIIPQGILTLHHRQKERHHWLKEMPPLLQKRRSLLRFNIHLAEHCNLKCKGCEHFSPLAPETYLDIAVYERDCKRLSELTGGTVDMLELLGGEPLLHPEITHFLDMSRKYFPRGIIRILTNGILLLKMPEEFWQNCKKNEIEIHISIYTHIDRNAISQLANKYGVLVTWDFVDGVEWVRRPLDLDGKQKHEQSAKLCYQLNQCIQLVDGKLYTCARIAYIKYFNSTFNQHLQVTDADYIDIYKAKTIDEIFDFLSKPMPFCRYCNIKKTLFGLKWEISKKEMSEWVSLER